MAKKTAVSWEADVFESSGGARDEEGEYRPLMTMIVETATGLVLSARLFGRAYRAPDALRDDLLDAASRAKPLPARVEVKDEATAGPLRAALAAVGVAVEVGPLNAFYAARRALGDARQSSRRDLTRIGGRKRRQ